MMPRVKFTGGSDWSGNSNGLPYGPIPPCWMTGKARFVRRAGGRHGDDDRMLGLCKMLQTDQRIQHEFNLVEIVVLDQFLRIAVERMGAGDKIADDGQ